LIDLDEWRHMLHKSNEWVVHYTPQVNVEQQSQQAKETEQQETEQQET